MTSTLKIDTADYPGLRGQESGRELDLQVRAVVTRVNGEPHQGGSPSELVTLIVVGLDIVQIAVL